MIVDKYVNDKGLEISYSLPLFFPVPKLELSPILTSNI